MSRSWTKPQSDAITARGGTLLVSAAAGSGKTAVLVERVAGLVCDEENPVNVDRLLIVTFSIAAAAEMRQRLSARLSEILKEKPGNRHIMMQQALLQKAQISTIHSFCLSLVRENFQNLAVTPDFTVADSGELEVMKSRCAADCMEKFYLEDTDGSFSALVELLSSGRDDSRIIKIMLQIYDFCRSHPFYHDWLDEKEAMYDASVPISETIWGRTILAYAKETIIHALDEMRSAVEFLSCSDEKLQNAYSPAFLSDFMQLQNFSRIASKDNWDGLYRALGSYTPEPLKPVRGDDPVKERLKETRKRCKDSMQELSSKYLCADEAGAKEDIADLTPKIHMLFRLVKEFDSLFTKAKAAKRRLDFSDLEHFAIRLLVTKRDGKYERTEQAAEIVSHYDYVLVDEYQDTNEAQDLIFTMVSDRQKNLFMVGDVKQSIYSFRQAMPSIFISKKESFYEYDGHNYPASVTLDMNFRSRKEVTDSVNHIFSHIMSRRMGEIDYDDRESLKCGAVYPEYVGAAPELLLADESIENDISVETGDSEDESSKLEAKLVASKIHGMITGGYMISSKEGMRPASPKDFCILMRSPKNSADAYVKALANLGIAAWAENSGGFLEAREVSMVISMLKALDNPLLDIELAAAMLSPLVGFTDDEIVSVRLKTRRGPLYGAVAAAARDNGGDVKCAGFIELLGALRREADRLSADRLILRLYEKTNALGIVSAMPMGDGRRSNLLLLVEYAGQYHAMGYKRLSGFVGFISRLEERGGDLSPANSLPEGADIVRIMSVHRSKGLEFPVVILADTAKRFNKDDLRAPAILHSKYGFACLRRDNRVFRQFPTIPMQAIRLEVERSQLSEEMRILYVALTRAREKLIISGTVGKNLSKKLGAYAARLDPHMASEASCPLDWILMSLIRHESAEALREIAGSSPDRVSTGGTPWIITVSGIPDTQKQEYEKAEESIPAAPDPDLIKQIGQRTSFVYPYSAYSMIPAKLAVSSAAKGRHGVAHRFAARPSFITGQGLTAAERGNAMHKFMQFADYKNAREDVAAEISRMSGQAFLSEAETQSLSGTRLRKFFESGLCARIFASPKVWRELRFMAELGKDEIGGFFEGMGNSDGCKIMLQGVADCVFTEDGEAVIVDYKTDRVSEPEELLGRYEKQLLLYAMILEKSLAMPVKECVLYSFALSREISFAYRSGRKGNDQNF